MQKKPSRYLVSRRAFIGASGAILTGLPKARAGTPDTVRIGIPRVFDATGNPVDASGTLGPVTLDLLNKAVAAQGTRVDWRYFINAGPDINQAFAAREIDLALYGDFPAVIARAAGLDIRLVLPASRGANDSYLVVPTASPFRTVEDLKGHKLALNVGRPWTLAFARFLRQKNLSLSDFQVHNLVMSDGDAAVASGHVDGQVTLNGLTLQARGLARVIWSTAEEPLSWKFGTGLFGQQDFLQHHAELTQQIVTALVKGAYFYAQPENRQAYLDIAAVTRNLPPQLREQAWANKSLNVVLSPLFDDYIVQHYRDVSQFAFDSHLIRHTVAPDDLLDKRFVHKALAEQSEQVFWPVLNADGQAATSKTP
ncbi:ABC transporter substrate-binding protein [Acetobacter sp. TBRC 12305]|uniref:ABC transporter substrate-binding protein n=1 Tax=Acetobacter garciniae TaxID=2817435 RepID=A0A939HNJ4_9PROT|nr:ABC transporter substrate-binding protein [Acetobacter garciniae]MBO1325581.1 ABC transporter substrate-binding protein [Acetobacter garciniae]MBX0345246.1 ABC transporter substrate-binding protein [Acetobacter garciniae]